MGDTTQAVAEPSDVIEEPLFELTEAGLAYVAEYGVEA